MKITLIAAHEINGGIGHQGQMPWHCPEDLAHFKQYTDGKVVVMGRTTWDSLPVKPLPKRENWVLSRNSEFRDGNAPFDLSCNNIDSILDTNTHHAYAILNDISIEEICIIGGASIYAQFLPHATHMVLTSINEHHACDRFFPNFDLQEWEATHAKELTPNAAAVYWQRKIPSQFTHEITFSL